MNIKQRFTEGDLQRIKNAVKEAERKISGEIVPVIVDKSGHYSIANYKSSLIFAAATFMAMIALDRYVIHDASTTLYYDPVFIFFVVILGGVIGGVLPSFIDPLTRLLVNQRDLDTATRLRAENAFLE